MVEECRNSILDIQKAYNKAIDDFKEELIKESHYLEGHYGIIAADQSNNTLDQIEEE